MSKLKAFDAISDIHIDHHIREVTERKVRSFVKTYLLPKDYELGTKRPVLCLAGDIFDRHESAEIVFKVLKEFYEDVIYVYGNHECYVYSELFESTEEKLDMIRRSAKNNNVHMLEGTTIQIQDVTFGGGSAWYDFSYGVQHHKRSKESMYEYWKYFMSDASLIADSYAIPRMYSKRAPVLDFDKFLDKRINEIKSIPENVDVMVSHVAPVVPEALPEKYKISSTGFYFFDGAKEVIRIAPKVWLYGHTHQVYNEVFHKTKLICNPFGYPSEGVGTRIKTINIDEVLQSTAL